MSENSVTHANVHTNRGKEWEKNEETQIMNKGRTTTLDRPAKFYWMSDNVLANNRQRYQHTKNYSKEELCMLKPNCKINLLNVAHTKHKPILSSPNVLTLFWYEDKLYALLRQCINNRFNIKIYRHKLTQKLTWRWFICLQYFAQILGIYRKICSMEI